MVQRGLNERIWFLAIAISIPIAIVNLRLLRTVVSKMPSFAALEACDLTNILLVIAIVAIAPISITVLMAIMIVTIVMTMAIMVVAIMPTCRRPIMVVGWWGRRTLLLVRNRVIILVDCRLSLTVFYALLLGFHHHGLVNELLIVVEPYSDKLD
jgi:hypothetical protein